MSPAGDNSKDGFAEATDHIVATCHGLRVPGSPLISDEDARWIDKEGYEGHEIRGAMHVTAPRDRVLELGTGLGIVSGAVALNCQPQAVLSYEANPDLLPHIRELHRVNRLEEIILVKNAVLCGPGPRPALIDFNIAGNFRSSSLMKRGKAPVQTIKVLTDGFAEVVAGFRPTVLLMDIEGGELSLLRDVDLSAFHAVVAEFHPGAYGDEGMEECKNILVSAGLKPLEDHSTRRVWTCTR
ncbi:FkbM family methyltransferase [Heliomarina baculiformis]|uniref:FkbM family methyltransferase n=1 Tax=Heliomarina baculiformis TaxID=2872036 RepID=UPI001EE16A38|nr:FkbM family methyltransferase [Heliomarina baculiformis]